MMRLAGMLTEWMTNATFISHDPKEQIQTVIQLMKK